MREVKKKKHCLWEIRGLNVLYHHVLLIEKKIRMNESSIGKESTAEGVEK